MMLMLPSLQPNHAAQLLNLSTKLYVKLIAQVDVDLVKAEVVQALQDMLIHRDPEVRLPAETSEWFSAKLNAISEKSSLGKLAAKYSSEMIDAMDVELGRWKGQKITTELIRSITDQLSLQLFVERIFDKSLHTEAKRRLVQLRIEASPYAIVKENAKEVEASMMQTGRYELEVSPDQIEMTTYSPNKEAAYGILVKQNVMEQFGNLLGIPLDRQGRESDSGLFPTISLRPDLRFKISNKEELSMKEIFELAGIGKTLSITPSLAETTLTTISFPLSFAKPDNLLFVGAVSKRGPAVDVVIEENFERLFIHAVPKIEGEPIGKQYAVVVDTLDTIGYKVGSIGGSGTAGADGRDGFNGRNASCPFTKGTDGDRGKDGGRGGPGGNGGDITVTVRCRDLSNCSSLMEIAARISVSEGGKGGNGGKGGKGGSSTTCTEKSYDGKTTTKSLWGEIAVVTAMLGLMVFRESPTK